MKVFIIIFILSLIGGVVGYFLSEKRNITRENGKIVLIKEYREDYLNKPSVIAIENITDSTEYKRIINHENSTTNIKFSPIEHGSEMILVDTSYCNFKKIAFKDGEAPMRQDPYSELWIWHEFLVY